MLTLLELDSSVGRVVVVRVNAQNLAQMVASFKATSALKQPLKLNSHHMIT